MTLKSGDYIIRSNVDGLNGPQETVEVTYLEARGGGTYYRDERTVTLSDPDDITQLRMLNVPEWDQLWREPGDTPADADRG